MIGLGKALKAVFGGDTGEPPPPVVPRALAERRPVPEPVPQPPWDPVEAEPSDTRSAERFVPNRTATTLTTRDGRRVPARIINVSRTGVAVEPKSAGVAAGEITLVGGRPVTPGRGIALGLVLLFKKPLDPKLCGPDIVL